MYNINLVDRIVNSIPKHSFSSSHEKFIEWCGKKMQSPQQKVVLGVVALGVQPLTDLNNKKVDEDTRKISCARTAARIIVGTATGFYIRHKCIKIVNRNSEVVNTVNKAIKRLFTPSTVKMESIAYDNYRNILGTFVAIGVMLITNFAIDAPLTQVLTNVFKNKINTKKAKEGLNEIA